MFYTDDPVRDYDRYVESLESQEEYYTDDDLIDRQYDAYVDEKLAEEDMEENN